MHLGELRDLAMQLRRELGERRKRSPEDRKDLADRTSALLLEFIIRTGDGSRHDPREKPEYFAGRGNLVDGFVDT